MTRTKLSVNVNKVATLRNTRALGIPSVVGAASACIQAGAHGITVHPRPDQRHIRPGDVAEIHALLKDHPEVEFNIEGNPFHDYMSLIERYTPHQCTLVPDSPDAFTSNAGWDIVANAERLGPIVKTLQGWGCRVSVFMDTDVDQIRAAAALGVDRIELYTEPFAESFAAGLDPAVLQRYTRAAQVAAEVGLGVNAGHDLNTENLPAFLEGVEGVLEVSIGHALIADAIFEGIGQTVGRYLAAVGA